MLLRSRGAAKPGQATQLPLFADYFRPQREQLHQQWENAADREKRSRTMFAQESIKFGEVASELEAAEKAIGSPQDLHNFFQGSLLLSGATVGDGNIIEVDLAGVKPGLKDAFGGEPRFKVSFEPIAQRNVTPIHRTHPMVEGLASYILNSALDREMDGVARRAGVIRTKAVDTLTSLLLLRLRFHIVTTIKKEERQLLAEETLLVAFKGLPQSPEWLDEKEAEKLLSASPAGTVGLDIARQNLELAATGLDALSGHLDQFARRHGEKLLENHRRVRTASGARGSYRIDHNPPDILGLYVYLPVVKLD
jgi:hypothetical protein